METPDHSVYLIVVEGEHSADAVRDALGRTERHRERLPASELIAEWLFTREETAQTPAIGVLAARGKTIVTAPPAVCMLWCGEHSWVEQLGARLGSAAAFAVDFAAPRILTYAASGVDIAEQLDEAEVWGALAHALGGSHDVLLAPENEADFVHVEEAS